MCGATRSSRRVAHCKPVTGRPNPTSAGSYSRTMFKLSFNLGAWSFIGANGHAGSLAIGNTLMLLMKPPTAQGGSALSFAHLGRYLGISSPCFRLASDRKHAWL